MESGGENKGIESTLGHHDMAINSRSLKFKLTPQVTAQATMTRAVMPKKEWGAIIKDENCQRTCESRRTGRINYGRES